MGHDSKKPQEDAAWTADRSGQSFRPGGLDDLPANAGDDATASTTQEHQPDSGGREHSRFLGDQLAEELSDNPVLFTQVTAHLQENHLHLPLLSPDHERMVRMRADTPELYEVYVQAIASQLHADEVARTLPYIAPPRAVFRGQVLGLIAVVAVLFFAGYLAYVNHPWTAGLVAGVDIAALASVFVARGRDR